MFVNLGDVPSVACCYQHMVKIAQPPADIHRLRACARDAGTLSDQPAYAY